MKQLLLLLSIANAIQGLSEATGAERSDAGGLLQALHNVQDDIARGDLSALPVQTELIERLRDTLGNPLNKSRDTAEWETVAVGYALDGAKPNMVRRLLGTIGDESSLHQLALAVNEYSINNMKEAALAFDAVDLNALDPRLAPYVALAMGTANLESDVKKAIRSFEQAILLAPGTLIEEVALRRLAILSVTVHDAALFKRSTNLYVRRYSASPFAAQFQSVLVEGILLLDDQNARDLADLIGSQPSPKRTLILLSFSEKFAVNGKLEIVKYISEKYFSGRIVKDDAIADRVALYKTISDSKTRADVHLQDTLRAIDTNFLTAGEVKLWSKAMNAFDVILKPLEAESQDSNLEKAKELYQARKLETAVSGQAEPADNATTMPEAPLAAVHPSAVGAAVETSAAEPAKLAPKDSLLDEIELSATKASDMLKSIDKLIKDSKL